MVAYVRGELGALERQRIAAHLGNCDDCASLRLELALGLEAATTWKPQLSGEQLETLVARLVPYMERPSRRRRLRLGWAVVSLAAAAVVLMALGGVALVLRSGPALEPAVAVAVAPAQVPLEPVVGKVLRMEPVPWLRLVAPAGWGGVVTRTGRTVEVVLEHGFVAASFVGGRGRKVRVRAPGAVVEVVGTRFFVEVGAGGATHVGVAEGHVRLIGERGALQIAAGESVSISADGSRVDPQALAAAAEYLNDGYLLEHRVEVASPRRRQRAPQLALDSRDVDPEVETGTEERTDVLALLERAEELVLEDRAPDAAKIYDACATGKGDSFAPYRALCSFELARLLGFQLGEPARARRMFRQLAGKAPAEVQRQAQLALCELDLAAQPCSAAACLAAVAERSGADVTLRREAGRLLERWGLQDLSCKATQ